MAWLMAVIKLTGQDRIDHLEGLIDLLTDLGTSQDDLATDEDQEDDLGLHHTVDETGEEFRLIGAEVVVARSQTLQTDGELDVARADNVLDLEVRELRVEAELLDDARILAGRKLGVVLGLGTSDDHLAGGEDERGGLGLTDTHDHGRETLWSNKVQPHCTLITDNRIREDTFGLYSALRACSAIVFRSRRQSKLTVATMFLDENCSATGLV